MAAPRAMSQPTFAGARGACRLRAMLFAPRLVVLAAFVCWSAPAETPSSWLLQPYGAGDSSAPTARAPAQPADAAPESSLAVPSLDETSAAPSNAAPVETVHNFGARHPACLEWTDSCFVCRKSETGEPACSTPGAACTPAAPVCRNP